MMFIVEHTVDSVALGGREDAAEEAHLSPLLFFLTSVFLRANSVDRSVWHLPPSLKEITISPWISPGRDRREGAL